MKPTRLAVRDRDLVDVSRTRQILSLRQFAQPQAFARNSAQVLSWLSGHQVSHNFEQGWSLVECGAEDCASLLTDLQMAGRDDSDRELALELLSPRMGDLGLAGMPFAVFVRELGALETASRAELPNISGLPSRRLTDDVPSDAQAVWEAGWRPNRGLQPDAWYAEARLDVQHVGDSQRRPIERLGYEAVAAIIEPLAVHSRSTNQIVGAGVAVSLLAPDGYEVRAIGVKS